MSYTMTYLPLVHVCYWSEFAATKLLEFEVFLLLVNKKGAKVSISKGNNTSFLGYITFIAKLKLMNTIIWVVFKLELDV